MPLIVSPATDGSARASCSSPVFAGFRSIRGGGRRQKTSNRRPRRSWLRWPRATATRQDWPPIGHQIGPKVTSLQANRGYRYRDSNPGFRRERAAEHPAPSRKIRHFQGKHELGGIAQRPNGSGDVRIWFGGLFSSRSRFQALQPDCRLARRRAHSTSPSGSGTGMVQFVGESPRSIECQPLAVRRTIHAEPQTTVELSRSHAGTVARTSTQPRRSPPLRCSRISEQARCWPPDSRRSRSALSRRRRKRKDVSCSSDEWFSAPTQRRAPE